jgi:hypothetical protein
VNILPNHLTPFTIIVAGSYIAAFKLQTGRVLSRSYSISLFDILSGANFMHKGLSAATVALVVSIDRPAHR